MVCSAVAVALRPVSITDEHAALGRRFGRWHWSGPSARDGRQVSGRAAPSRNLLCQRSVIRHVDGHPLKGVYNFGPFPSRMLSVTSSPILPKGNARAKGIDIRGTQLRPLLRRESLRQSWEGRIEMIAGHKDTCDLAFCGLAFWRSVSGVSHAI